MIYISFLFVWKAKGLFSILSRCNILFSDSESLSHMNYVNFCSVGLLLKVIYGFYDLESRNFENNILIFLVLSDSKSATQNNVNMEYNSICH